MNFSYGSDYGSESRVWFETFIGTGVCNVHAMHKARRPPEHQFLVLVLDKVKFLPSIMAGCGLNVRGLERRWDQCFGSKQVPSNL